jgi:hypothetical protein
VKLAIGLVLLMTLTFNSAIAEGTKPSKNKSKVSREGGEGVGGAGNGCYGCMVAINALIESFSQEQRLILALEYLQLDFISTYLDDKDSLVQIKLSDEQLNLVETVLTNKNIDSNNWNELPLANQQQILESLISAAEEQLHAQEN